MILVPVKSCLDTSTGLSSMETPANCASLRSLLTLMASVTLLCLPGIDILNQMISKAIMLLLPRSGLMARGENNDYFADHCDGVTVGIHSDDITDNKNFTQITTASKFFHLLPGRMRYTGSAWAKNEDAAMVKLLKKCLGDSDATSTNNVDI